MWLLAARGLLLFPRFASGGRWFPFAPCTVHAAVTTWLLTLWGESGTKTDIPIAIGSYIIQIERKRAAIITIIPIAAAKRKTQQL